jgi:preprotein translocase subunit SecG
MLLSILLTIHIIVCIALILVILMQRSEGGGLGMGGSPSGLMSARGATDFLTRTTAILATMFILLSISLAFVAAKKGGTGEIDSSLQRTEVPTAPAAPVTTAPANAAAPATEVPLDK